MRRIDAVAGHLQREIGLHAGAHVERAVVEKRPAAMRALDAAQIVTKFCFELEIRSLAKKMDEQDIFGGNRAIRLELEHEVTIGPLGCEQRIGGARDAALERGGAHLSGKSLHRLER